MILDNIGFIASDTSRTRAYLNALKKNNILPSWVCVLPRMENNLKGSVNSRITKKPDIENENKFWKKYLFDPSKPLIETLKDLHLNFSCSNSSDINSEKTVELIKNAKPRIMIYSGYGGYILKKNILDSTNKLFLHVHGGYLPNYKGSTTNYYSILQENKMGASSIILNEKIDSGPLLYRIKNEPPLKKELTDHYFDSIIRSRALITTLKRNNYFKNGFKTLSHKKKGEIYYVIHPVLKTISILAK